MKIIWSKVTWYSRLLAVSVFVGTIWLGIYFWGQYKEIKNISKPATSVSDISNWKIYNNILGYAVRYPSSYHVAYGHDLVNYDENLSQYENGNSQGVRIQFYREVALNLDLTKSSDREEFFKTIQESDQNIFEESTKISEIRPIGEFTYHNNVLSGPGGAFDVYYAIAKDGKSYYGANVWHMDNDVEGVMGILSTFTFLSNTSAVDDWKTYRNEKYGFEFKYPNYWGEVNKDNEIANQNLAINDQEVWIMPNNTLKPDAKVMLRFGVNYKTLAGRDVVVDGHSARFSTDIFPVRYDKDGFIDGYYKDWTFYINRSEDSTIIVVLNSPVFSDKAYAESYNTDDFSKFISLFRITK